MVLLVAAYKREMLFLTYMLVLSLFFFFFQRDFYYDTLRAIENGINLKIKQNPLLGDTNIAKDLVTILADS